MLFNTLDFAIFLPLFFVAYLATRKHILWRNLLILGGSYLFYGWWDVRFLQLIVISTAVDYVAALLIERGRVTARARLGVSCFVLAGVVSSWAWTGRWPPVTFAVRDLTGRLDRRNLRDGRGGGERRLPVARRTPGIRPSPDLPHAQHRRESRDPATFKYFDFFAGSLSNRLSSTFGVTPSDWTLGFVLPVGISFYLPDDELLDRRLSRKTPRASLHRRRRVRRLLPSACRRSHRASFTTPSPVQGDPPAARRRPIPEGGVAHHWGLFKLVVADNMAVVVNATFGPFDGGDYALPPDGLTLWSPSTRCIQIYGDFSGYTDIARGHRDYSAST